MREGTKESKGEKIKEGKRKREVNERLEFLIKT